MFTEPLPSNGHLLQLHSSVFERMSKYFSCYEVRPLDGHRPVESIVTHDFSNFASLDEMLLVTCESTILELSLLVIQI
jgi:hypothetical protein